MKKLFSNPFSFSKRRKDNKRKAGRARSSPPPVTERQSSLYSPNFIATTDYLPLDQDNYPYLVPRPAFYSHDNNSVAPSSRSPYAHAYRNYTALTLDLNHEFDEAVEYEYEVEPRSLSSGPVHCTKGGKEKPSLRDRWGSFVDLTFSHGDNRDGSRSTLTSRSVLGLSIPKMSGSTAQLPRRKEEVRSSLYAEEFEMPPFPAVPPRSRHRPVVASSSSLPPGAAEAVFQLPVEAPLNDTPPLSSGSSVIEHDTTDPARSPVVEVFTFGRKRRDTACVSKDPYKVRDGAAAKGSSSGVYTPPTFPGAQGRRPSRSPSAFYTPTTFTLYPVRSEGIPSGSSRSSSLSTSGSEDSASAPRTPISPTVRWSSAVSGTLSGIRRISSSIASREREGNRNISLPSPPHSAQDSFFPSTIHSGSHRYGHSRTSSWSQSQSHSQSTSNLVTPTSCSPSLHGLTGLGIGGLSEMDGRTSGLSLPRSRAPSAGGEERKGRRKPVPKVDEIEVEIARLDVEETHAL